MGNDTYLGELAVQPAIRFRPRLLLLAAFLASSPLYPPNSYLLLRFAPDVSPAGEFLLAMLLSCFAIALVVLLYSAQRPGWPGFDARGRRIFDTACAVLYAATQTALWTLLACGQGDARLLAALGALSGISVVPVIMRWVRIYLMDFRSVMFYGAIACAGSAAAAWFVSLLPDLLVVVSQSSLAVLGSVLPFTMRSRDDGGVAARNNPERDAHGDEEGVGDALGKMAPAGLASSIRTFLSIVWVPLLGFLVCSFMMAAYSFDVSTEVGRSEYTGGIVASIIVVALCALRLKGPFVILIDRIAIPACVAASIVLGSFPVDSPMFVAGAMLVYAPLTLLSLFALSSLVAMASAGELPVPFVFSAAFLLNCTASLLGMTVQVNMPPDVNPGPYLWTALSVYFGIVVVHLGYVSWKQFISRDAAALEHENALREPDADRLRAMRNERIATLAEERSLTKRECEILQLLSLGYGSVYIAKSLFISDNTVRTHIRNIYRKLAVKSREELLSLVNELE